jgi:hypothetical protein
MLGILAEQEIISTQEMKTSESFHLAKHYVGEYVSQALLGARCSSYCGSEDVCTVQNKKY